MWDGAAEAGPVRAALAAIGLTGGPHPESIERMCTFGVPALAGKCARGPVVAVCPGWWVGGCDAGVARSRAQDVTVHSGASGDVSGIRTNGVVLLMVRSGAR